MDAVFLIALEKFPFIAQVLFFVGALKIVVPPLISIIDKIVQFTPYDSDNEKWNKIKNHNAFIVIMKILEYTASIKLPKKKSQLKLPGEK